MAPVSDHLTSRRRAEAALDLRVKKRTWAEIASALNYGSRSAAKAAVDRLLATTTTDPAKARRMTVETLRLIQRPLFDMYDEATQPGGDPATATMLARELRAFTVEEAKLDDLYSPKRVEVVVDATPNLAAAEWLRQVTAAARPAALPSGRPVIDAEVIDR